MREHPVGAILQRDKETYAIVPRTPVGLVTPDDLEALAGVARKYNIPVIKITSGQRFALVGVEKGGCGQHLAGIGYGRGQSHRVVPALCSGLSGNCGLQIRGSGFVGARY